jgi:hypothetical protein
MTHTQNTQTFNGTPVKSITTTNPAKAADTYKWSVVVNGHLIQGLTKEELIDEYYTNREKYDIYGPFNAIEFFVKP